jgi:hyaluronoglucosaminidase
MVTSTALNSIPPLGIIEGFFGPVWSWSEREHVVRTLSKSNYSFYIYAPKGDTTLRRQWSQPFTTQWIEQVSAFAKLCKSLNVEFGLGLSPYGLQADFGDVQREVLRRKLDEIASLEIDCLAILFDDMDAHVADLVATQIRIVDFIANSRAAKRFVVCPSYYSDDVVLDVVFGERPKNYLRDMGKAIDRNIDFFWTGEEVCARQIGVAHVERIADEMGRKPMLWDNYPVNDGARMSSHLHLRAFTGREALIANYISGHAINPALQATLSLIPALTLPMSYAEGSLYEYTHAFKRAAEQVVGKPLTRLLQEDMIALQDLGSHRYDAAKFLNLRERYGSIDHRAAREILRWLNGDYAVSSETVHTQ